MPEPPHAADWASLYDHAPCGLMATGADGLIRLANTTLCDWLGRSPEALSQLRFQDLLTAGGRIFHQTHLMPLLLMQGSVSEVKLDVRRADGVAIPMVLNVVRRDRGDGVVHEFALFVAEDRTAYERELLAARKRAEQLHQQERLANEALSLAQARLTTALDAGALHVWEADLERGAVEFSPGVALLLGRSRPGAVRLREWRASLAPGDDALVREVLQRVAADSARTHSATLRLDGEDGVQRTVMGTARAVVGADGQVRRAVGVLQDISELVRQRVAAEDRALFAEQMIGIVSHDLRNPLAVIRLGSQTLQMAPSPGQAEALVGNIRRASDRASRLIEDLLDFTRARIGGGLRMQLRAIDLHAMVAAELAELKVAHPGALLRHDAIGEGGAPVHADPDRLAQLLGNLVANAIAYGAPGMPITVASRSDGARWSLAVHNWGPPVPGELRERLFEPMVRGSEEGESRRSVGLGLYIVAQIARAHGAAVSVDSDPERGTRFTVSHPA